jgi:hypothetical protein
VAIWNVNLSRRALLSSAGALTLSEVSLARAQLAPEALGTRDAIVPVLRSFIGLEADKLRQVQNIVPYAEPATQGDYAPVIDHFVGDLHIRYGFASPKGVVHFLREIDLRLLDIKREEVLVLALANYRKRYPGLRVEQPRAPISKLAGGGRETESSVMLDAAFWERQRRGTQIIAGAPARDVLVFTTVSSEERLEDLRLTVQAEYAQASRTALSKHLYVWRDRRWAVYEA